MLKVIYDRARYLMRPRKYNMQNAKPKIRRGLYGSLTFLFLNETFAVGTHWKRLTETLPMSTITIVFDVK